MKLKKILKLIILPAIIIATCLMPVQYTFATDYLCDNNQVSENTKSRFCSENSESADIGTVITNILQAVIAISGIIAAIFVVVGGIQYITSAGDAGKLKKAKDTILYALIGIVVCALAFAIVNWAVGVVNGSDTPSEGANTTNNATP